MTHGRTESDTSESGIGSGTRGGAGHAALPLAETDRRHSCTEMGRAGRPTSGGLRWGAWCGEAGRVLLVGKHGLGNATRYQVGC